VSRRRGPKEQRLDPVAEAAFIERLASDPLFIAAQAVLALKIVVIVLLFDPQIIDAFALVKSAAAHATSLVLGVLLLTLVAIHGRRIVVWSPAHLALGALLFLYAAAAALALDQETALFGIWRRYLGLGQMLDNALLYCAAVVLLPRTRDLMRLGVVALATATLVVLYMFAQRLGLDPVNYVEGRNIPGTFGQPDVAGAYAAIAGATALAVALWTERVSLRAGLAAMALLSFVAALLTNSRGGFIGLAFGWAAVLLLVALWPRAGRREALAGLVGAAAVGIVGAALTPVGARFLSLADLLGDRSAQGRLEIWGTSLRLIAQRPWLGLGPDNFGIGYPAFREERSVFLTPAELQNSTHNWVLHIATSTGLLGTLAFIALLGVVVVGAIRLARAGHPASLALVPLAAFFGQGLVTINDLGTDWIPWLAMGVIAGSSGSRLVARERTAYPRWILAVAAAVALIAAGAGTVAGNQRVAASDHFGRSESLIAANRGAEALPEAIAAVQADPRRAEYWSGLGTALNASDRVIAAGAAFAEAARLKPSQPLFWTNLALMRLFVQDTPGASLALSKATAADRWDPQSRDLAARVALLLNDAEKASREGHLAVELQPTEPTVYEAPTIADIRLGKLKEAEDMLRNGLTQIKPPASLGLHILLAQVLHAEKRDADARVEVAAALAIDPQNASALKLQQEYK
jgi:O-antigen ligase/Flp pilus assembly protein TadD